MGLGVLGIIKGTVGSQKIADGSIESNRGAPVPPLDSARARGLSVDSARRVPQKEQNKPEDQDATPPSGQSNSM